jgi:hypothetical protein
MFTGAIAFFREDIVGDEVLAYQSRATFFKDVDLVFITKVSNCR